MSATAIDLNPPPRNRHEVRRWMKLNTTRQERMNRRSYLKQKELFWRFQSWLASKRPKFRYHFMKRMSPVPHEAT